jgi:putative hydrolases of HD superfamily
MTNKKSEISGRLDQQIQFIVEIDKLKAIIRRTTLIDRSRDENSAEHSWHIALMAPLLAEYSDQLVDVFKVVKMLLVHDVVEIDAGDTYCYDVAANLDKADREQTAADRLFGLLPSDQAAEFRSLWEEFETNVTADAKFANALDRLQPFLNNYHTQGKQWQSHGINAEQVRKRMSPIGYASQSLDEYVRVFLADAVQRGYVTEKES